MLWKQLKNLLDVKKYNNKKLKSIDQEIKKNKVSTIEKKGKSFKLFYNKNIYGNTKGLYQKINLSPFLVTIMKSLLYIVSLYIDTKSCNELYTYNKVTFIIFFLNIWM